MTIKSRTGGVVEDTFKRTNRFIAPKYTTAKYGSYAQSTLSYGHPYTLLGRRNGRSFRNIGGPFATRKVSIDGSFEKLFMSRLAGDGQLYDSTEAIIMPGSSGPTSRWIGTLRDATVDDRASSMDLHGLLDPQQLDHYGATAVARVAPTNPIVDLSTSVAEFIGQRKLFSMPGNSNGISGEYLNLQLGVLPVISDVQDTIKAIKSHEEVLAQYERDSGRLIHRRYDFPETETESVSVQHNVFPGYHGSLNSNHIDRGTVTTRTLTKTRVWFSGAFTYHLPDMGWRRTLAHANRLYGAMPGAETLWNVVPLSFVADYFANTGDVLRNLDAIVQDGLVMPYGYIMRERSKTTYVSYKGRYVLDSKWVPYRTSYVIEDVTKERKAANPFGFGLTDGDLSSRQWSILAALGISRR